MANTHRMKPENLVRLTVQFLQEGDTIVAYCPSLDLSAQGASLEDAKKAFQETFELFIEELNKAGKLEDVLEECGWRKAEMPNTKNGSPRWMPPRYIGNLEEEFSIPV